MLDRPRGALDSPWLLAPVVALAALLRFWNISSRGLLYWDEGKFLLEGVRLLNIGAVLVGGHGSLLAGKTVGTAKPTHALLIALSYALLGIHDYSPLILDAAASTATVIIVYFLARRLFSPAVGLIAALLLAVSEYDILYARSALSESDATFLFVLGTLLWSRCWVRAEPGRWMPADWDMRWRLVAGGALGAAFTTNYRALIYIAVLVAFDLVLVMMRRGAAVLIAGSFWLAGLALVPLIWELAGLVAQASGHPLYRSEITRLPTSYLAEAAYQIHQGRQSVFHFEPITYLQWYVVRQGWGASLLLAAGLVLAGVRRTTSLLLPALLIAVPYAIYTFAPFIVPRNLATTVPFASILAAAALVAGTGSVLRPGRVQLTVLVTAALILALVGGLLSWRLTAIRSGFADATLYLARQRASGAVISNEIMKFYLRGPSSSCHSVDVVHQTKYLPDLARKGYRYVEIDVYDTPARRDFLEHGDRVARFLVAGTQSLGENPVASENGTPPGPHQDQHVDIYRIRGVVSGRYPACSLDRVV